jgi:5'-deoxynucleotidase YfbR-like HD superfamily hydrolase
MTLSSKLPRAWVLLGSGRRIDLLEPSPLDWDDEDLAVCLARTNRWGGHSRWDLALSVAQHSLLVLALRQRVTTLSASDALRELLHDADEGFLGFDAIAPVKPHLGAGYARVVERLQRAIAQRYGLRP